MSAKALTLRQPWASLVAVGAKTIETRSFRTSYRGELLIHAGKAPPPPVELYDLARAMVARDGGSVNLDELARTLPLGAVVASCRLVDCVPTEAVRDISATLSPPWYVMLDSHPITDGGQFTHGARHDQFAFGDFSPGRYAWLLEDIKPTTDRCPRCWGAKELQEGDEREIGGEIITAWRDCPVCRCAGVCPPVPMRGRQGLFRPEWPT